MKRSVISLLLLSLCVALSAQTISYRGEEVELGPHAFYVDGSLSDAQAAQSPYMFRSFNEAMAKLNDGTSSDPMRVYLAPWVYWVDDPDDPQDRVTKEGQGAPIGLTIRCEALQLLGMSTDPRDVVLASNRGQTQGARGNFTMFDFYGSDLVVKDLTMGNYCNIDLEYPRDPKLGRQKRNPAITQAQLAFCHGDRIYVENVRFVSRLNLTPLSGSKRILFVGCHFESTDDSLNHCGVHLGCDLDFWGRQPFGSVDRYGTVFMDCDFNVCHGEAVQAVSKGVGRHSLVDVRYHAGRMVQLGWTFRPEEWLRCYQYNISLDGAPAFVGAAKPYNTVVLDQKAQLFAYRLVEDDGTVLYNTYNLLRGDDAWDPQGIKARVEAVSRRDGRDYSNIPTCLDMDVREASLQTGKGSVTLTATPMRHLGYPLHNQKVYWKVQPGYERFVTLSNLVGETCEVTPVNREDKTQVFDVIAYTAEGLEVAAKLTVAPDFVPAPAFIKKPVLRISGSEARVEYELDLQGRGDESLVTWYRCDDRKGGGAVPVSVSRMGGPRLSYKLTREDAGHYLMVGVAPKHLRCESGEEIRVVSKSRIKASGLPVTKVYSTDFSDFPCDNQLEIKPGYWTVDAFIPQDTRVYYRHDPDLSQPCWLYGTGINGAKGYGIQQLQQGARLRYTPLPGKYGDMSVTWQVDPAKDGGQGFGSARQQYLDLFVKFDTRTLSGYAVRVIRTTKYANAVDVLLMKYTDGRTEPVSGPVTVDCFLTGCVLSVLMQGDELRATVSGPGRIAELASDPNVHHSAELSAKVEPNTFGGFGLQHTSTVGTESRILVHSVSVEWK